MALIRAEKVSKRYQLGGHWVTALHKISLSIEEGVFLAIAGPSGSGKSTLLNLIGCIDTPTAGKIIIDDRDTSGRTPDELAELRARTIGFIFQTFNLLPVLSAEENVEYPLLQFKELDRNERKRRVAHFLDVVRLSKYARHRPSELSGGQRQRVAIARALVTHPRIVLADEPTANLDSRTGAGILALMKEINRSSNTTFVFSTHDKKVIAKADRLVRIDDGRIRLFGVKATGGWVVVRPRRRTESAGEPELGEIER
uniref:LolD lipoprotein releasing system, ATP-binding protein n=1 Tax=uncultured bacterium CSL11 TaxID=1091566 RepID=G4WVE5_9BACT|nr:LolD lipoprotein releasing system, ATP-binding protein [uncultured bacterium CSL11]